MNIITIRQFQREFYKHLDELPLVVTKNGEPYLKIMDVTTSKDNVTTISDKTEHVATSTPGENKKRQVLSPLGSKKEAPTPPVEKKGSQSKGIEISTKKKLSTLGVPRICKTHKLSFCSICGDSSNNRKWKNL